VVLSVRGELDLASAPILEREVAESLEQTPLLVLDVEKLQFIDSTGLRVILAAHEQAREGGRELALTRGSRQIQRLLEITRAGEHLRIIESPDELLV
jgi:anti-anti-sigma factor